MLHFILAIHGAAAQKTILFTAAGRSPYRLLDESIQFIVLYKKRLLV